VGLKVLPCGADVGADLWVYTIPTTMSATETTRAYFRLRIFLFDIEKDIPGKNKGDKGHYIKNENDKEDLENGKIKQVVPSAKAVAS